MNDDTSSAAALTYPFETPPMPRGALEVAPGVHWIRMPLPYDLDHINVWAIAEQDGWAVVDTGARTDAAAAVWRDWLQRERERSRVTRVFVTHMHPDHVGMAGWLSRTNDCRLWMTRGEYFNCRVTLADTGLEAPDDAIRFYRQAGWSTASIDLYRARFGRFGQHVHALPPSYRRIQDGESIRIGAHDWNVITGNGHSPEHACFYCPDLKLFISGDQVLPRISSNVSVYPIEPDADPMADWLASINKLRAQVPDDVLVLPSHNDCFRGLHARLDRLERGQQRSLERLRSGLKEARRAVDVFTLLFARPIADTDMSQMGLATGESLACLNYLLHRGELTRELRDDGAMWYALAAR
ncbi:MBL fold metallo-hydrolase [Paraburkholderia oxyphila]|uniref:MBL fold metallo-hydrolase n=1 Tax=Paraburkholderia oxyphila TaxID=614212 RepID=UPI000480323E|nr:MBL fold metallo-hydrolase [Paraburkholderia oxyphila]